MTNPIALFDIDGTLTTPRGQISKEMIFMLKQLQTRMTVGIVGGSDLMKQKEQLGDDIVEWIDYSFSQNGLVAYKHGKLIHSNNITNAVDNKTIKSFINFCLRYISDLDIPVKRGTFIEYRSGMINVSPIGRNCTLEERNDFEEYDKIYNIRSTMLNQLQEKFGNVFDFTIGGQISIDVYPIGWDKTYCLQHLEEFDKIYFFGDKTAKGGNDYTLYNHEEVDGYAVEGPAYTIELVNRMFF